MEGCCHTWALSTGRCAWARKLVISASTARWAYCVKPMTHVMNVTALDGSRPPLPTTAVQWTATPYVAPGSTDGWFLKVIGWQARSPSEFRSMVRMYAALDVAAADGSDPPPASLQLARLYFGYFRVVVQSAFLVGHTEALTGDITTSTRSDVAAAIADALVWLAWHDLLYRDLRPPNVMLAPVGASPAAVLVDLDDAVYVPGLGQALRDAGTVAAAIRLLQDRLAATHGRNFTSETFKAIGAAVEGALAARGPVAAPATGGATA